MKIVVLGGTGFVGSAVSQHLGKGDDQVIRLSRPAFDLTIPSNYKQIPPDTDILIHAAGYVGNAPEDEIIWKTNVMSTYYLVQYLNANCALHLMIYLSSGAVYGMGQEAVTCSSPLRPENLYGVSKLLAERMTETMLNSRVAILRLFFPFGPLQRPPRLIPDLIQRIARGELIDINGPSNGPVINPIFIDDLVKQIDQIIFEPSQTFYNLGGPSNRSIRQIAEAISIHMGKQPRFRIKDTAPYNLVCEPDIRAWSNIEFEEHLAVTIKQADYL